jgi:hypothetical protein
VGLRGITHSLYKKPPMALRYVPGSGALVHAEYMAFAVAHQDEAADSLAILHHLAVSGMEGLDSEQRDAFGIARPYCYQTVEWGVFFEAQGPWSGPCIVTLLVVADFTQTPIEHAKREAIRRWNAATAGG